MPSIELSGLFLQPLANRVRGWLDAGKLDEDDLESALTSNARAFLDHPLAACDWATLEDVESLIALASSQLGGDTGLVEAAESIVDEWCRSEEIGALVEISRGLIDGPGFLVCQASERLVRHSAWVYEGGRDAFSLRVEGCESASLELRALLGGTLSRLSTRAEARVYDVRFEGVDGSDLVVFGELESGLAEQEESRLHRAALIP